MSDQPNRTKLWIPAMLAFTLVIGFYAGSFFRYHPGSAAANLFPSENKVSTVLTYIEQEYVDSIDRNDLIEKTIPKILEELDPHSVYIPASDLQGTNEQLMGAFDGIGVQFNIQEDTVVVVHPIPGGPSAKAGILAGDRIVQVNDSVIAGIGISNDQVMSLLKGRKGTEVKILVHRSGDHELIPFDITRDKIPVYSVDASYEAALGIGYIKVNRFAKNTFHEFLEGAMKLKQAGCTKFILDLRGNSGGFLEVAIKMADEFLPDGNLIVYTEGKSRPKDEAFSSAQGHLEDCDLVVLIDEWSASASEIVAGAIQDNDRGTIIGRRSFGKGLVQEQSELADGSAIRLTIARYYTPSGRCIQKPYDHKEDYYYEAIHGYSDSLDSLKPTSSKTDSTRYFTKSGRVVYGGGGILPDILTEPDTSGITPYFMKIRNRGHLYQFAFDYADRYRKEFAEMESYQQLNTSLNREKLLNEFLAYTQSKGISPSKDELSKSTQLISTMLVAQIVRNIFDDAGYYPVIQEIDTPLLLAIDHLKKSGKNE